MSRVRKTTLTVVVLHDAEEALQSLPLADIAREIHNGMSVGQVIAVTTEIVPAAQVAAECRAIGSEPDFFETFMENAQ